MHHVAYRDPRETRVRRQRRVDVAAHEPMTLAHALGLELGERAKGEVERQTTSIAEDVERAGAEQSELVDRHVPEDAAPSATTDLGARTTT